MTQALIAKFREEGIPAEVLPPDTVVHRTPSWGGFSNDVGYSDKIIERFRESIRYCHQEEKWLVFDGVVGWQQDESGRVKEMVADYSRELWKAACDDAKHMEPAAGKSIMAAASSLGHVSRMNNALEVAKCSQRVKVSATELDADPFLVGVSNGVVNIQTREFSQHACDLLVTRRLGTHFDANATSPHWRKFLEEVQPDPEIRGFLQRLAGYCLSGEIREHILPFHFGIGANGKGSFLEQGLLRLMGTYGAKASDSLVYASERGNPPFLEISQLAGIRLALGQENAEGGRLNEKFLKDATGGDRQKGRFLYAKFVEYWPSAKIHLVGNHRPKINGTDDGIWRRFILIDWPVSAPA